MLDKGIEHNKEFRRPYRGSKRSDFSCRNHGGCPRCYNDFTLSKRKLKQRIKEELKYGYRDEDSSW
jgi:hypothetical protein